MHADKMNVHTLSKHSSTVVNENTQAVNMTLSKYKKHIGD